MKLTPTFNDLAHGNIPERQGNGRLVDAIPFPNGLVSPPPHVIPALKRGRKPKVVVHEVSKEPPAIEEPKQNVAPTAEIKPLKVALIGTAPSSRLLAPYNDPSWTIWACSPGNMNMLPRADAWFEIHGNLLWPENRHYGEPYIEWLKKQNIPVYMQNKAYVPNAIPLPFELLVKEFGPYFFTSSFSWMMAFAMVQPGIQEMALYGIDMASRDEYILQRPGAYYFFDQAAKRGIRVSAPYESDIMQPPSLYGLSDVTPFGRKVLARTTELKARRDEMVKQRDHLNSSLAYIEGALEDLDYVHSIWGGAQSHSYNVTIHERK